MINYSIIIPHKNYRPESYQRLDKECIKIKRKAIKLAKSKPHIVAISKKMKEIISISKVLSDMPVTLIHNGVDTNIFHSYDKEMSRHYLNIPLDATVILFSSYQLTDTRFQHHVVFPQIS